MTVGLKGWKEERNEGEEVRKWKTREKAHQRGEERKERSSEIKKENCRKKKLQNKKRNKNKHVLKPWLAKLSKSQHCYLSGILFL